MSSKKLGRPRKKRGTAYNRKLPSFEVVAKLDVDDNEVELFLAALCLQQGLKGTAKEWASVGSPNTKRMRP